MRKIKLVTDSTTDLSQEQIKEMGITVVPLSIMIDGETYVDGDLTPDQFLERMENSKTLPKSSQPATGAFVEAFDRLNEPDSEILCIMLSEQLSGTCQSARIAAEMSEAKVTVVDSKLVSSATQFQLTEASRMIADGHTVAEIVSRLVDIREKTQLYIAVGNLDNLVKGGRISKGKAMIGNLLSVKPIVKFKDGIIVEDDKVRSIGQAIKFFIHKLEQDLETKTLKHVAVIYVGEKDTARTLEAEINKVTNTGAISKTPATSVVATYVGRGTLAISYFAE